MVLPCSVRCALVNFKREIAEVGDAHGILELGLDAGETGKRGWVGFGRLLGIFVVV